MMDDHTSIDLEFQDFPSTTTTTAANINDDDTFLDNQPLMMMNDNMNSSTTSNNDNEPSNNTNNNNSQHGNPNASLWSIEYYQTFFDITTSEVLNRIQKSFTFPLWINNNNNNKNEYFTKYLRSSVHGADIWGPFWIVTTLIVLLVITSNIGGVFSVNQLVSEVTKQQMLANNGTSSVLGDRSLAQWTADFSIVSMGATILYSYLILAPMALYFVMRWKGMDETSIVELWCLFGYALVIVVPAAVICVLNYGWIRWLAILISFAYSGGFLLANLIPLWRGVLLLGDGTNKPPADGHLYMLGLIAYVALLQLIMAIFIRLYFYTYHITVK